MAYTDITYYKNTYKGTSVPDAVLSKVLDEASRQIDTLTYNRIRQLGFDHLTPFQKEIIQISCCEMAEFNVENEDLLTSVLSSYSINGVSAGFAPSMTVTNVNGVILTPTTYSYLAQSGLCCANLGRW
ncbi:MAG: hypothetical protein RR841_05810 [Eubacterium sp.]